LERAATGRIYKLDFSIGIDDENRILAVVYRTSQIE